MSKSLGNFFIVREVLDQLRDAEVLRLFLLSSHYRGPINYSPSQLQQADETLAGLYRALKDAPEQGLPSESAMASFREAMDDDFNTPEALAVAQTAARELNSAKDRGDREASATAASTLRRIGAVLGLLQQDPTAYLKRGSGVQKLDVGEIEALLERRKAARLNKNFHESDRIRDELAAAGVLLEDKPGGVTEWRRI
jgi:cysteinyl-tRNA synthetase